MSTTAPFGSWKSPITSDLILSHLIGLITTAVDGANIYWSEMRPEEGGRSAVVCREPSGKIVDILPQPFNARTRVHEYGGGSFLVHNDVLFFSNFADQRFYRLETGSQPRPLTPAADLRYADGVVDLQRERIIAVREDHTVGDREAVNTITAVNMNGGDVDGGGQVLVSGNDFYSNPRVSPDGTQLAWLTWNHPNMPWDGTELWLAEIRPDGALDHPRRIAGGLTESIFQPAWSPDGTLYFVSDRTDWWNLYRWQNDTIEPLHPMDAEFGEPQWVFGMSDYTFVSADDLVCTYYQHGLQHLAVLNTRSLEFETLDLPYTEYYQLCSLSGQVVFIAGSPTEPRSVILLDLSTRQPVVLRRSSDVEIDPGYLSIPQEIEFPTENGLTAFAIFYPPQNRDFTAPEGERPPLIVESHGGPTGATSSTFNLGLQYWTSRGFAVVDVNYGGSTGYGRPYRERLKGQWGIVDVDDCVNAARYLANTGLVDVDRLGIKGGSAGGYTTLCALAFRKAFKVGACYFGVSDAEALALDTHKFESRYLDGMIGPYPEKRDIYIARSPIHFVDQINCALILFQGSEDKVVPPSQSRKMYESVRDRGLPVAYLEFPGEQHGFRGADAIRRAQEGELYFYSRIFGFDLAEPVEPIKIENI